MTRMFKQLVAASRKKLSKAGSATREQQSAAVAQIEPKRKPDFEPLESRVLFSGVGNGFNKKSVTFIDGWGDSVLVRLIGGPAGARFDITLDGGAPNNADIQNITINGKATSSSVLDVFVKPKALTLSDTYTGGTTVYGDPMRRVYAVTKANRTFTPGFVEIGSIYATTNLRGITMNGADFANIDVTGSIGTGSRTIAGVSHAQHGGIAIDLGVSQFRSGLINDPVAAADFGNINVSGSVDSLILHGRTTTPSTNNLNGSITIGGSLNSFDARFSDVLAPISAASIGTAFFHDILANVTTTGAIGQLNANNLVAGVTAGGAISGLALSGSLSGTAIAQSFGSVSVNGNFTGLLQSATGIGSVVINSGTAFTGTIESVAGNIGNITLAQASTPFSGHVKADAGNIGNLTAGFFSSAAVSASGSIGNITSNATSATVTSGIVNSVFSAGAGGIGNISSVASITHSQFEASGGAIGNVTVLQGGINGDVIGGSTSVLATSVGNITSNLSIEGTSVIASGAIGNITSIAGFIGGSSNTAQFIKPGVVVTVNLGGTFNINGVIAVQGGQPGPKSDVFVGGSIGNIYALSDISGNVITATAGNIGNITSHEGRIAFDAVSATGNIGNIYANSQDATFAFDSAGNVLETVSPSLNSSGAGLGAFTGYALVPSASAIDHSSFTAGGTIGNITARASAVGGYLGNGNGIASMPNRGIDSSDFIAGSGIGNVYAVAANTTYHDAYSYDSDTKTNYLNGRGGLNAAIFESNFISGGTGIGNVKAIANGGPGIYYSTFRATGTGNIGNVYARSVLNNAIFSSSIESDNGNVGVVKGVTLGGNGTYANDALEHVVISAGAGPGGTGKVGGVYGASAHGNGIDHTTVTAGTGGIGYITGVSQGSIGHYYSGGNGSPNGITDSTFVTTGPVGNISGSSAGANGINDVYVSALSIGNISGVTSGYGSGIVDSQFYAQHGVGNITGSSTTHVGNSGLDDVRVNANTLGDGNGAIGTITGTTAGDGSGIYESSFYATNIGTVTGKATTQYGYSGISESSFFADSSRLGTGTLGSVTGTTMGSGNGIGYSTFDAGAGIGNVYGGALGAYSHHGIYETTINADDAQHFTSAIGNVTGVSKAVTGNGDGINDATVTAGAKIGNVLGTTTAPNSGSYGIKDSHFYANAGLSSETGGSGTIGTVTGTANANGAYGIHGGISNSKFIAGGGPGSYGYIGNITGTSKLNGAGSLGAYGIERSTFVAGSGSGKIGTVTGYALAQGSQVEEKEVNATGIAYGYFYAGTGIGGTSTGTIGSISGTGVAESAFGGAFAAGVSRSVVSAGSTGTGTIGTVTGTATATAHFNADAFGIYHSNIQAGVLSGGKGYIGNVTGTASATSQGDAQRPMASSIPASGPATPTARSATSAVRPRPAAKPVRAPTASPTGPALVTTAMLPPSPAATRSSLAAMASV